MKAQLFEDREAPGDYRVEAIDDDGGCEVAIFSGPRARERAAAFARAFYDEWSDTKKPGRHEAGRG